MNLPLSTLASVLSLAIGGVSSYFKTFIEDQKDFKNRGTQLVVRLTEAIATAMARLLREEIREKDFDEVIRGTGFKAIGTYATSSRDFYSDVSSSIVKLIKIQIRVSRRLNIFRYCHGIQILSIFVALVLFVFSLISPSFGNAILIAAIALMFIQVFSIVILYRLTRKNEDDDEIS